MISVILQSLLLALLLLQAHATDTTTAYVPPNAKCIDYEIPVSVSAKGVGFLPPKWTNNYELINFVTLGATRPSANFSSPLGPADLKGDYTISATFCSPTKPSKHSGTVILASHGLGFEKGYWNAALEPETYNFVQHALSEGYPIFFYDRVGTGKSSRISGFVAQGANQVQILGQIAAQVKAGHYVGSTGKPKKLVLLGHSFGSFISTSLLAQQPNIADAAVLTGLSFYQHPQDLIEAFEFRIANGEDKKFADRDAGYLTSGSVYGNVNTFFKAPSYTLEAVEYSEATKQPFAITEVLSIATLGYNATAFKGSVLVQNGEYDYIVCGGYAPGVTEQPTKSFFSGAKTFKTYIQPNTGHGLTYHLNATAGYKIITDFLSAEGF